MLLYKVQERSDEPMAEDTKLIIEILNNLREDVSELKTLPQDINKLKSDIQEVKMMLENETNKSIKLIAEGHFDLERKLNTALQLDQEKELLNVRLNFLEGEMERLKKRIETA